MVWLIMIFRVSVAGLVEKAILVVGTTETKTQKINKISFKSEKYMLT